MFTIPHDMISLYYYAIQLHTVCVHTVSAIMSCVSHTYASWLHTVTSVLRVQV